jgi:glycosyltransferase involved in cell wall biosynthesis
MRKSGVFVLPSYEEGQGVVLVEALASGTPCVGTTAGGIPDVVTEDVGAVVPPGDVSALAQAIIQTLVDPVRWETLCRQARQRAETVYDWDQIAQGLISIYKEVIGR